MIEGEGEVKKVLVTGATGFLGSGLVRELIHRKHKVVGLARQKQGASAPFQNGSSQQETFPSRTPLRPDNLEWIQGDLRDLKNPKGKIWQSVLVSHQNQPFSAVFHLAGLISYEEKDRALMEEVNVQGTRNILELCRSLKVERLVYSSSVVAVGAGRDRETTATHPLREDSPYDLGDLNLGYYETKRAAELLVQDQDWVPSVILCPSTIYGPGDAKKSSRSSQVKVAQGRFPFYPTWGGVSVVDLDSVVDAFIAALEKGRPGERYILSGENWTLEELLKTIASLAKVPPPRWALPLPLARVVAELGTGLEKIGEKIERGMRGSERSSENFKWKIHWPLTREALAVTQLYHWYDSTKAQRELGFQPGSAQDAIRGSVEWLKRNL